MDRKRLVLASSSPYRYQLLARLGLPFEAWAPDVDEAPRKGEYPKDMAIRLAKTKALAGAAHDAGAWIIGSDQVADHAGAAVGKPGSVSAARAQLRAMSGQEVFFHTALCLAAPDAERIHEAVVTTYVKYRPLDAEEIERYLQREPALDCAGSAKSEGLGIALLERLASDDPTALIGLPLVALAAMLRQEGFEIP